MLTRNLKTMSKRQMVVSQQRAFAVEPSNAPPVRVAVTGAAGNIAYSILFRIASGEFLGTKQRVILHLVDLPFAA